MRESVLYVLYLSYLQWSTYTGMKGLELSTRAWCQTLSSKFHILYEVAAVITDCDVCISYLLQGHSICVHYICSVRAYFSLFTEQIMIWGILSLPPFEPIMHIPPYSTQIAHCTLYAHHGNLLQSGGF